MNTPHINEYFAAANGYCGFRSYFPEIFNPSDFLRIYIIKGGPGTGKSSLMRKAADIAKTKGYCTEKIYCSSDPKSLDGIIIESNRGRVAFLDGTAPHQTDTQYPGAVDEIINLADGFELSALTKSRNEIIRLNSIKKSAYSDAYFFLSLAGRVNERLIQYAEKNADIGKLRAITASIFKKAKKAVNNTPPKIKLVGAFGKDGYTNIFSAEGFDCEIVEIGGDEISQIILMRSILKYSTLNGLATAVSPSPFDEADADLIIANNLVIRKNSENYTLCAPNIIETSRTKELKALKESLLLTAREKFGAASLAHFQIEDIYKGAVDFAHNDSLLEKTLDSVDTILS